MKPKHRTLSVKVKSGNPFTYYCLPSAAKMIQTWLIWGLKEAQNGNKSVWYLQTRICSTSTPAGTFRSFRFWSTDTCNFPRATHTHTRRWSVTWATQSKAEIPTTVLCHTHSPVWMVSPDRNSWLKIPQRPKRLESSFYGGWLYVEMECVCVLLHVRLHVFELTEVVCCEWSSTEDRSNSSQQCPLTHSGAARHLFLFPNSQRSPVKKKKRTISRAAVRLI